MSSGMKAILATLAAGALAWSGGAAAAAGDVAPVAPEVASAELIDAGCPYGWSTEVNVWFGPPRVDTDVVNLDRGDGCTLLDLVWAEEPFASHGAFMATVARTSREFVRDGLLTHAERAEIVAAAARTRVGGPADDSVPNTCPDRVALTFDDGPSFYRTETLRILRDRQVPATFFDVGMRIDANPRFGPFQVDEGHLVLNHTYTHPNLNTLLQTAGPEAVRAQMLDTEEAFDRAGVDRPFLGMRPPFLAANAAVQAELSALGFTVISGDIHAEDWLPDRPAQRLRDDVVSQLRPGGNIFLHDGPIDTVAGAALMEALPLIIDDARELGYCFGTFDSTGEIVADRLVSSDRPIPVVTEPVPYLPLLFGGGDPPDPFVIVEP
ncbi:polysaccharide deacetylase family protein [Phytoactinopolyspora limicola]|uniref:polysaccharide deacetylase family protein n=1 Tax=Phytoactinopolyspora limicola TaxID=2715536 RepID=UPI00140AC057|nr:polysaccharide deacetylase family protein [Phytoactinopolyspora limicola]